jgi:hypothetical protein
MSEIVLSNPVGVQLSADFRQRLTLFVATLNTPPGEKEVKDHPFFKSNLENDKGKKIPVKYVPIEVVESKLNHFFMGMWQTFNFKYQVIVNEVVGDLELAVWHPEAGVWIRRVGTGSVMIQQHARGEDGEKMEQNLLDINRKIANTLVKDMGHLKAECIKNAAKSLGQSFGANLNREIEDPGFDPGFALTTEDVLEELKTINNQNDLSTYFQSIPTTIKNDKRVRLLFTERRVAIQKAENDATMRGPEKKGAKKKP